MRDSCRVGDRAIPNMNRFGMFSWFGYPISLEERLEMIKAAGFHATGFWLGKEEELVAQGRVDLIPDLIRSKDLFLEYVHAPDTGCSDLWSGSAGRRGEWMVTYRAYLDLCKRYAIPFLVMHISQSKEKRPVSATAEGAGQLRELARAAEDVGVKIAIENTMQPSLVDFALSLIESDCVGLCYDTSHDFLYSSKPGTLLENWGYRLLVTHFGDNDGVVDRHWLPGMGGLDWGKIGRLWPAKTYKGSLTLEVFPKDREKESPSAFTLSAYQTIRWLSSRLFHGEA